MRGLLLRLRRLLRARHSEHDIDEELRFHVDMEADRLRATGLSPREARRRALVAFGGEDRWREDTRAARGSGWLEDALRDIRFALRELIRAPGFAVAAIGTIALGVGATTAIYSVVDQVVLSPLPYPDSDELVTVWMRNTAQGIEKDVTSWPNFTDWRDGATRFDEIAAVVPSRRTITGGDGAAEEVLAVAVSRGFFELVGAPLALGRSFRDDEVEGDFGSVAVLSHELFTTRYGADPSIVGRTVVLNDSSYEVVGVAEAGQRFPRSADLWIPLAFGTGREWRDPRGRLWLDVVGRLTDGASLEVAQSEMDAIAARLAGEYPEVNRGVGITLEPLQETIVGEVRTPFLLLLGAVALVMLIAVVNVANLLLARGMARTRELAARRALGAGRGRIVRQVLAHSAVLGVIGGVVGAALASAGVVALVAAAPADLPRLDEVGIDWVILGLALGTALGASVVFGLAPAMQATRVEPGSSLRAATRGSLMAEHGRLRGAFVGAQFALAFVLLIGSGLLIRSFLNLRAVDPGFRTEGVLSARIALPPGRYPDNVDRTAFQLELLEALESSPEVEAAGTISTLFLSALPNMGSLTVEARPDQYSDGQAEPVTTDGVSPGFFAAAGMEMVAGREFLPTDGPDDLPVAIANQTFVRLYLDGLDPIGQRYTWGAPDGEGTFWFTIVGVVADSRRSGLDAPVRPAVFQPITQRPRAAMDLLVRAAGDPLALAGALRGAVSAIDPNLPLSRMRTLEQAMADGLARREFVARILGFFALAALALAAIGIFGVMAYVVGRRTREIGVRVALGAARQTVLAGIFREGMLQALLGLGVGAVVALFLAGSVRSQLFGLEPSDPATFVMGSLVLLAVAAAACIIPARRAASVDAMVALREE